MKRPVLLEVEAGAAAYGELIGAVAATGERCGWLDLRPPSQPPPAGLAEAADAGVLRAVAAGGGRVAAVKPIRGAPVLDDLLREHFRGCRLVLVRGGAGLVRLAPDGEGWRLAPPDGPPVRQSTGELVASLRRPGFWRRLAGGRDPARAGD